jgi:hypothetical protein
MPLWFIWGYEKVSAVDCQIRGCLNPERVLGLATVSVGTFKWGRKRGKLVSVHHIFPE